MRSSFLLLTLSLFFFSSLSKGNPVRQPHVEAELVSEVHAIRAGQPFWVALRLKMEEGWHTYWQNPGDSGLATSITWQLPPGFKAGPLEWPYPERIEAGPLVSYGYEGEVFLLTQITPPENFKPAGNIELRAKADWLVCKESCIPGEAELLLKLRVDKFESPYIPYSNWKQKFDETRKKIPVLIESTRWRVRFHQSKNELKIEIVPQEPEEMWRGLSSVSPNVQSFFPFEQGIIKPSSKIISRTPEGLELPSNSIALQLEKPFLEQPLRGILLLSFSSASTLPVLLELPTSVLQRSKSASALPPSGPSIASSSHHATTLGASLAFAFLGGLILNLMPCVFPVLSLKILGFVKQSHESKRILRLHGLVFTFGILVSFWALSGLLLTLRAGGEKFGWGFQLQSPLIVTLLALMLFGLGLNLLGVFEINFLWIGSGSVGRSTEGLAHSFWSGVLATVVATPCTAPFMGVALAFALLQPPWISLLIFTSLALGLAAPYLFLSFSPSLLSFLPRPGAWMESFKQAMAFPLFGAVIWLTWVLALQVGSTALLLVLFSLLCLALAGWVYGRWSLPHLNLKTRIVSRVFALCFLAGTLFLAWTISKLPPALVAQSTPSSHLEWKPFSPELVETLKREKQIIFIDFTAAWCLTCQVNKAVVFQSERVQKRFQELDVALIEADWTRRDSIIAQALAFYGRSGVPCYVLYSRSGNFEVLPELLTSDILLQALERAEK